jgi:arylsulfatase A-like enzyme
VQSIDIAPTIFHSAGIAVPNWADGAVIDGAADLRERYRIVLNFKDPDGSGIHELPTRIAIRHKQDKLIVSCEAKRAELYDIERDPGERRDRAKDNPATTRELWRILKHYLANQRSAPRLACDLNPGA